jgi:hypothetical protein
MKVKKRLPQTPAVFLLLAASNVEEPPVDVSRFSKVLCKERLQTKENCLWA